jgi:recombination protein RecT
MSTPGTAIAKTDKISDVRGFLAKLAPNMQAALPKHITAERMARVALTACQMTPALLDCDRQSLALSVLAASALGLEIGNGLGHAYLIPFKGKAQLIVGYRGMIDLARRSGQLSTIYARVVSKGDAFSYAFGLDDKLEHVPSLESAGEVTHVYAVAKLRDGGRQFDVMTKAEVDAIRKRSLSGGNGPWVTDYEEMAKKTVIRRLFKMLPVSVEMQRAVSLDEQAEHDSGQQFGDFIDTSAVEEDKPAPRTTGDLLEGASA